MADKTAIVTVVVDTTDPKKAVFTVSVDPEPVDLRGFDGVEWTIDDSSTGWTFTKDRRGDSDGIDIKGAGDKFKDKKGGHPRKKHKWERLAADRQMYRYTISVTNETVATPATVLSWDPSIMNN